MFRLVFTKEVSLTTMNSQTQGSVGSPVTEVIVTSNSFEKNWILAKVMSHISSLILVKNLNELGIGEYEVINF